ncbi:MAG: hypothetical protein OJF59_001865 [Cytophagales bacterium]|nr:MAG: hypothetical protein OJF59_001865 [Cytophagales bacterium]
MGYDFPAYVLLIRLKSASSLPNDTVITVTTIKLFIAL